MGGDGVDGVGIVSLGGERLGDGAGVAADGVPHVIFYRKLVRTRGYHHVSGVAGLVGGVVGDVEVAGVQRDGVRRTRSGKARGREGVATGDVVVGCYLDACQHPARACCVGGAGQKTDERSFVIERKRVSAVRLTRGSTRSAVARRAYMCGGVGCTLCLRCGNGYRVVRCAVTARIIYRVVGCIICTRFENKTCPCSFCGNLGCGAVVVVEK